MHSLIYLMDSLVWSGLANVLVSLICQATVLLALPCPALPCPGPALCSLISVTSVVFGAVCEQVHFVCNLMQKVA